MKVGSIGRDRLAAVIVVALSMMVVATSMARAQPPARPPAGESGPAPVKTPASLADASLEALLNVEVTSGSKHEQSLRETAAAMFVVTQEDIRRSGALTIADALRIVPGLHVARIDGHRWAITARGFNYLYANKLLVMIDGRSVYTRFFAGVHWDVQDTAIEDIDRIEVIRGPGATLWGANAVTGVINIITKSAAETQGGAVTILGGSDARAIGTVRYGGRLGSAYYRLFAKGFDMRPSIVTRTQPGLDAWSVARGGFRIDGGDPSANAYTVQGEAYGGHEQDENDQPIFVPPYNQWVPEQRVPLGGGHLLARWDHRLANYSTFSSQLYVDHTSRTGTIRHHQIADVVDLDLQHHVDLGARHDIVYGAGARWMHLKTHPSADESYSVLEERSSLINVFAQDEITLVPNRVRAILGSKFEYDEDAGFDVQPNARVLWTPSARQSVWASVARAVRTPSLLDRYADISQTVFPLPTGDLVEVRIVGNPEIRDETMIAYEAGYRVQLSPTVSFDVTAYYDAHRSVSSLGSSLTGFSTTPVPHVLIQSRFGNENVANIHGVEAFGTWQPASRWTLRGGYTWYAPSFSSRAGADRDPELFAVTEPGHQVQLMSRWTPARDLEVDATMYGASSLFHVRRPEVYGPPVPAYSRVDARVGWSPVPALTLSIVGQNLFDGEHMEFPTEFTGSRATLARRAAYAKLAWTF